MAFGKQDYVLEKWLVVNITKQKILILYNNIISIIGQNIFLMKFFFKIQIYW